MIRPCSLQTCSALTAPTRPGAAPSAVAHPRAKKIVCFLLTTYLTGWAQNRTTKGTPGKRLIPQYEQTIPTGGPGVRLEFFPALVLNIKKVALAYVAEVVLQHFSQARNCSRVRAACGQMLRHAPQVMHSRASVRLGLSGLMAPMGQTAAQWPHKLHWLLVAGAKQALGTGLR